MPTQANPKPFELRYCSFHWKVYSAYANFDTALEHLKRLRYRHFNRIHAWMIVERQPDRTFKQVLLVQC